MKEDDYRFSIQFSNPKDGKILGTLLEENGKLTFVGEVDKAGKVFTDFLIENFKIQIEQTYELKSKKVESKIEPVFRINENFIPKYDDKSHSAIFALKCNPCGCCNKPMIPDIDSRLFPTWIKINQNSQLERSEINVASKSNKDNKQICKVCEAEGRSSFICSLCNMNRKSDLKEFTVGDPESCLCKVCYDTVTAKEWENKKEELFQKHRYDYD